MTILALLACAAPPAGPVPVYNPDGDYLFDAPWPSDGRVTASGAPDLSGFTNPGALALVDDYIAIAASAPGWGTSSPIYVRFSAPIDVTLLPDPQRSADVGSPLVLIDVDPTSPAWGERWPVQWEYNVESTAYQPDNTLAVAPLHGFPLRANTRYALVVTTAIAAPNAEFAKVWTDRSPEGARFRDLAETLFTAGLVQDDVAVATVFTTGSPTSEMATLSRFLKNNVGVPVLSQPVVRLSGNLFYDVYEADYLAPYFTTGERPYSTVGGGFRFDDAGRPVIAGWDRMRLSICTPKHLERAPVGGWPVAIQQHGTGGDYLSHCSGTDGLEIASQLASVGVVSVGIDQPLHGNRGGEREASDFDHFNFLNPESGGGNFRQGALDAVYLAHALASQDTVFSTPAGEIIPLDPDHIVFFGHSQGALTGALAAPFMSGDVDAAVLSAAGGELAITMVQRKDPFDIKEMIEAIAQFEDGEELTTLHPLAGLIQQIVEVTDPVNYGRSWFLEGDPAIDGQRPISVLLVSGAEDEQTPTTTSEVLAAAAGLPRLAPRGEEPSVALAMRAIPGVYPPASGDARGFDGRPVTAAFTQWPGLPHWAVWMDTDLAGIYREFLRSAVQDDAPVIVTAER